MHDRHVAAEQSVAESTFRTRLGEKLSGYGRNIGLLLAVFCALLILAILSPKYFTLANFVVLSLQMAFIGITAVGTAILIISGNVDLSIGSMYALAAVSSAMLSKVMPAPLAFASGIALGGVIGFINGSMVWRIRISPIIITLGSMTILRGVVLLVSKGYGIRGVPDEFTVFAQTRPFGIPVPVLVMVVLAIVTHIVLEQTTAGRHVFAVGGSKEASETAGISVRRLVFSAFAVNGLIVGLAGALAASRMGTAMPSFGTGLELDAITAVILGGVAFSGGEGNILGVMLAVALLGVINSGLVSLGIDPFYTYIVKGSALIIAVALDQITQEQREKYRTALAMRERRTA